MRDPNRISRICKVLEATWKRYPDMRLTQLLSSAIHSELQWKDNDLFYVEDTYTEKALELFYQRKAFSIFNSKEKSFDSEKISTEEIREMLHKIYDKISENDVLDYTQSTDLPGSIVHLKMNDYDQEMVEVYNKSKKEFLFSIHIDFLEEVFPNIEEYEVNRLLVEKNIFIQVKVFSETISIYAK